jgi:hypothetical protein
MSTLLAVLTLAYVVTPAVLPVIAGKCEDHGGKYERLVRQEIVTDKNGFAHVEQKWEVCHE